ncbi:MAG: DUF106 domain-containing protein [Candidatus Hydrothermarchaeales archaeon]
MGIFDPFYSILDLTFHPMFNLASGNQKVSLMVGIFVVSILIALITTVVTARVIDQDEMKTNKKRLKEFQEKVNKAREKGDEKKLKKITAEMMQVQSAVMKSSFRPMIYTFVPIIIVFKWLAQYAPLQTFILEKGYLISLPFTLPKFGTHLGWLGWYIICSFMTSTVIRKIFKIQM